MSICTVFFFLIKEPFFFLFFFFQAEDGIRDLIVTGVQTCALPILSAAARRDLATGNVDSRLLITLSALAAGHDLRIAAFGAPDPGGNAKLPLRAADLAIPRAVSDPAAYLESVLTILRAQHSPLFAAR